MKVGQKSVTLNAAGMSSASVNGYAYIPQDLTTRALQLGMIKAYGAFYLRPSKVKELLSELKTTAD